MTAVYIGIGANLGNPIVTMEQATLALAKLPETNLLLHSRLYRSKPLGPSDQPDYSNAVALIDTTLSPLALLDELQALEIRLGRQPSHLRWGPRVIDLDILLYGQEIIQHERLTIPHPGLDKREFVLYPLAEIAPDLILPTGASILTLKELCDPRGIE